MSDCKRPLEYLLAADPGQLRGRGDDKVSRRARMRAVRRRDDQGLGA